MKRAFLAVLLCLTARVAAADPMYVPPAPRLEAPTDPVRMPTIVVPHEDKPPIDKRPYVFVGGLLVLVAVFLWNRDRARKLEAEHGPTPRRERRWRVKPEADAAPADEDSAALADAAEEKDDKHE